MHHVLAEGPRWQERGQERGLDAFSSVINAAFWIGLHGAQQAEPTISSNSRAQHLLPN